MITNKLSAFGVSVVVAFAAVLVLLVASPLSASADKGTATAQVVTIPNSTVAADQAITVKGTHVSGKELCTNGAMTAVASKTVGGSVTFVDDPCGTTSTTVSIQPTTTATSITVASTTGFPDSGSIIIGTANLGGGAALEEILDYTSKTKTTIDGLTRARAGTSAVAHATTAIVYPVIYTQIQTATGVTAVTTAIELTDASGLVFGAGGEQVIFGPGLVAQDPENITAKVGDVITHVATGRIHAMGVYVAQVSAVNTDSAVATFVRTASTTTTGSFEFIHTVTAQASTKALVEITLITDKPVADAATATVASTSPTALPVLIALTGTDVTETAAAPTMDATVLPTKGTLGVIGSSGTPDCVDVGTAATRVVGSAMTNCTGLVKYTPLLGATGTDTFSFTFTNGTEISAAALVTITLPAAEVAIVTPTVIPAFHIGNNEPLVVVRGINLGVYNGGTLVKFDSDCRELSPAENILTLSVIVDGDLIIWIVGAPAFVNNAFTGHFADGVPNNTLMIIRSYLRPQ